MKIGTKKGRNKEGREGGWKEVGKEEQRKIKIGTKKGRSKGRKGGRVEGSG